MVMGKIKFKKKFALGKVACICCPLEETISSNTVSGKTGGNIWKGQEQ